MDLTTIADLAKQGGRLDSDRQWELADALADCSPTQISTVAVQSGRNESTLLQYARASQRWPKHLRVQGVSFSAHRVALSWHDPHALLVDLKDQFGSPTVQQVRQAMGLEGHPAIELLERGIAKMDGSVSQQAITQIIEQLLAWGEKIGFVEVPTISTDEPVEVATKEEEVVEPEPEEPVKGTWVPPVRTSDVAGM